MVRRLVTVVSVAVLFACEKPSPAPGGGDSEPTPPIGVPGSYERIIGTRNGGTYARRIAVDTAGNAYVTGYTDSSEYPTTAAAYDRQCGTDGRCNGNLAEYVSPRSDAFVTKLDRSGAIAYSTYLGGSRSDEGHGIAVDARGRVYVTGQTLSPDFPVTTGQPCGAFDAFVARLSADGSTLEYSRCIGGSGTDTGNGIAVDDAGSMYVAGWTNSSDFPTVQALQPVWHGSSDFFVIKLRADGTPQYATYLGGRDADYATGIAVDAEGNVVVSGDTSSPDFPAVRPLQNTFGGLVDAAVSRLDRDGGLLLFSTNVGGATQDIAYDVATSRDGHTYLAGWTNSPTFPATPGAADTQCGTDGECNKPLSDAFAMALDPYGALEWSTFLGGSRDEVGHAVHLDSQGRVAVAGETQSLDLPLRDPLRSSWPPELGRGVPFLALLDSSAGTLVRSTLVPVTERPSTAAGLASGPDGAPYVAGRTSDGYFVVKLPRTAEGVPRR